MFVEWLVGVHFVIERFFNIFAWTLSLGRSKFTPLIFAMPKINPFV